MQDSLFTWGKQFYKLRDTEIILVAAITCNRGIGYKNDLLVKDKEDLKHFKELTTGYPIVMGRKTFESIGSKPLPNRQNYVLTRQAQQSNQSNLQFRNRLDELLGELCCSPFNPKKIFIIGGADVYNQAINYAHKLVLTVFPCEKEADAFFPRFGEEWVLAEEKVSTESNFVIQTYERII